MRACYVSHLEEFDSYEARQCLEMFGYVVISSFWDKKKLRAILKKFDRVVSSFSTEASFCGTPEGRGTNSYANLVRERVCEIEEIYDLLLDCNAVGRYEALLDSKRVFVHPSIMPRYTPTDLLDRALHERAHQDYPEVQGSLNTLTFWFPLADLPTHGGTLAVSPGTHQHGILPVRIANTLSGIAVAQEFFNWHFSSMALGDCMIFNALTVHSVLPNRLKKPKFTIDFRVQPFSDPVSRNTIDMPDRQRHLAQASENLTERAKSHWRELPPVVAYNREFDDERDRQALDLGSSATIEDDKFEAIVRGLTYAMRTNPNTKIRHRAEFLLHQIGRPLGVDLGF